MWPQGLKDYSRLYTFIYLLVQDKSSILLITNHEFVDYLYENILHQNNKIVSKGSLCDFQKVFWNNFVYNTLNQYIRNTETSINNEAVFMKNY